MLNKFRFSEHRGYNALYVVVYALFSTAKAVCLTEVVN